MRLPVDDILPEFVRVLSGSNRVILTAPPGAGKTTRVAPYLLSRGVLDGRILMLEPRRLAARAAASRIAEELGERVGQTAGYRIRLESKVSASTRIEVITEGILTRMLQSDPEMRATSAILFDEFHERSMHADLGLALALEIQETLRPDLKIVCMSATLDADRLSDFLKCPVVASEGRLFPVHIKYSPHSTEPVHRLAARAVREALALPGDILVFLPGAREIHRTAELVEEFMGAARVLPLYGDLPEGAQKAALLPDKSGRRKIILSTNIAETSLTIEGVRTVIDSGFERRMRFDPGSGLSSLHLTRISRASADQRAGRAGRTESGTAVRLYDEEEYRRMKPAITPEILEADPAELALEMARWGGGSLQFLDPPPESSLQRGRDLLTELGFLDNGRITSEGVLASDLPVHPRLSRMLLGCPGELLETACRIAVLLSDRDRVTDTDLSARLANFRENSRWMRLAEDMLYQVRRARDRIKEHAAEAQPAPPPDGDRAGFLALFAYPDRIGALRPGSRNRYILSGGKGAALPENDPMCGAPYIVCCVVEDQTGDSRIRIAGRTTESAIRRIYSAFLEMREEKRIENGRAVLVIEECLGSLVLSSSREEIDSPEILAQEIRESELDGIWDEWFERFAAKASLARSLGFEVQDFSRGELARTAADWLLPYTAGAKTVKQAARGAKDAFRAAFAGVIRRLEELLPESIVVPSGSVIRLEYSDREVVLAVKLQELFGLTETPAIAGGRLPVTLHLLSPARRPIQVTKDLAGFWSRTYPEVRKELRGRYPKHPWPEDPLREPPARGTKKR